jgi:hypothetical protein
MGDKTPEQRKIEAQEKFKVILGGLMNGPDLQFPAPVPLPPYANAVDKLIYDRLDALENKAAFIQKVVWRTSAAVIGAVLAGPARDLALSLVASLLGGS